MRTIFRSIHGSRLYGTNVADSDLDIKEIIIPEARSILLQQTGGEHNSHGIEWDAEDFALHKYMHLLKQNQTLAVEMLFTPDNFIFSEDKNIMDLIRKIGRRQLTNQVSSFAGYCRVQAGKFSVKTQRVAAVKLALGILSNYKDHDIILSVMDDFVSASRSSGHIGAFDQSVDSVRYIECCGRKIPEHATIKFAKQCYQKVLDEYGKRTLQAETNNGDFKSLYHAVRVCREAIELLLTGKISFPRPEADLLLKIRRGEIPVKEVFGMIEAGLAELEDAKLHSALPDKGDGIAADLLVQRVYAEEILTAPELRDIFETKMLRDFIVGIPQ